MNSTFVINTGNNKVIYLYDLVRKEFCIVHPLVLFFHQLAAHEMLMKSEDKVPSSIEWNGEFFKVLSENKYQFNKYQYLKEIGFFSEFNNDNFTEGKLSPDDIENTLSNLNHIVFEMTDKCNLNCVYCGYGELYYDHDKRNNIAIPFKKIVEIVNYLLPFINSASGLLYVGFYGGEPLLQCALIQKAINYINSVVKNREIIYTMTSNGVLIKKNLNFLIENNIQLLISLDGDKRNHSYRAFKNGKDSFKVVFKNAKLLQKQFPDYFKEKVNFMAVIHNRNTVKEVHDFIFKEFGKAPRISPLDNAAINPDKIDQFNNMFNNLEIELSERFNDDDFIKNRFIDDPNVFRMAIFIYNWIDGLNNDYYEDILTKRVAKKKKVPGGACLPFQKKLFVTVNGKILPCERINQDFYLGFVDDNGINMDFKQISGQYNLFYDRIRKQCEVCYSSEHCSQCFLQLDYFPQNSNCHAFTNETTFTKKIKTLVGMFEKRPELFYEILSDVIIK